MSDAVAGDYTLIEDDAAFADLLDRLDGQDRYAIDTEFHRERTYFPHVALVQIADRTGETADNCNDMTHPPAPDGFF